MPALKHPKDRIGLFRKLITFNRDLRDLCEVTHPAIGWIFSSAGLIGAATSQHYLGLDTEVIIANSLILGGARSARVVGALRRPTVDKGEPGG